MKLFLAAVLSCVYLAVSAPKKPAQLKINGQAWTVHYFNVPLIDAEGIVLGSTECADREILLFANQSPQSMALALAHEISHAFTCGQDGQVHNDWFNSPVEGNDHPGIVFGSEHWTDFIQQNPDAVRWIETRR